MDKSSFKLYQNNVLRCSLLTETQSHEEGQRPPKSYSRIGNLLPSCHPMLVPHLRDIKTMLHLFSKAMNTHTNTQTDRQTDKESKRERDRETERYRHRETGRQIPRHTNVYIAENTCICLPTNSFSSLQKDVCFTS